ncbi:methyltransferase domain-containing protein [Kangiella sp. HD9-110m-PIT-SAG07]|nr:methyltransferase domain-containing protein [Kangiella sp. HD9-110m-PIT-SAG07]
MTTTSAIIDLRPTQEFLDGHLPGAVHIPFEQLVDLWHELPPKGSPLTICVEQAHRQQALELFQERNFEVEHLYSSDELTDFSLIQGNNQNRLWYGNPVLESHGHCIQPNTPSPTAIDIGCGSGRDTILMGLLGYQVYAVDYFDQALERVEQSARRWDLKISTVEMDCRKHPQQLIDLIEQVQPQLIMQSRFLHRPLFDIYQEHLSAGCKIVIHTFLEGAAKFGKPKKADFLLKNDELSERFHDWSVLLDQVHYLEDGRPLSLFIAQKP